MLLTLQTFTRETIPAKFAKHYDTTQKRVGKLVLGDTGSTLYTIERPFISNPQAPDGFDAGMPYISSVPLGEYELVLRKSPSKGLQWHFFNPELGVMLEKSDCTDLDNDGNPTWQRFSTMFHIANFASNVHGCGGPGKRLHVFPSPHGLGVASSAVALKQLKEILDDGSQSHRLVIK
jgi:hypothetical protein